MPETAAATGPECGPVILCLAHSRGDGPHSAAEFKEFRDCLECELLRDHRDHLTDGRWHDGCRYCLERRSSGGTGVEGEARQARPRSGGEILVEHLEQCTDAQAVIVVDGSADDVVASMASGGWTLSDRVDYVAGKRIRFMTPPSGEGASDARDGEA